MLVILGETLKEILATDHAALSGLESILASSYNGEHLFTSSFPVVNYLIRLPLSNKGRAVLQRIRSGISQHGHLPYPDSFVIEIKKDGLKAQISKTKWLIPVTSFQNKAFPPSIILGENMLDAKAYYAAAQQARAKFKYHESCNTVPDAGGGSQTPVKLEAYLNSANGYCFCITDGDYTEPTASKSAVSSQCEGLLLANDWPAFATDFDGRSIENIIPLELIEDSFTLPIPQHFHKFKIICDTDKDLKKYIDIKLGLKYCKLSKIKKDSPRFKFWWSRIKKHNLDDTFNALENNPPHCHEDNCRQCILIEGLGGGTLRQVVNHFSSTTAHKLSQRIDTNSTWCELGKKLYHWTISDKPLLS